METLNLIQFVKLAFTQGGGSFNLANGSVNPAEGYMVATKGNEHKVQINIRLKEVEMVKTLTQYAFRYIADTYNAWAFDTNAYLGLWFNKADGLWYFDISEQIEHLEWALKLGRNRNQISVWDCSNKTEVGVEFLEKREGLSGTQIEEVIKNHTTIEPIPVQELKVGDIVIDVPCEPYFKFEVVSIDTDCLLVKPLSRYDGRYSKQADGCIPFIIGNQPWYKEILSSK